MHIEKIIYFGTAPIAVPALEALHAQPDCQVLAVCTQPDRPSGRKRKLTPSAVKSCAERLGIPVLDPEKISTARETLAGLQADLAVVFAYGQYIPASVFSLPARGSINFHPSLLPRYRGASPIQSALLDGCETSGLTVLEVSEKMDSGDLLYQETVPISPEDTSESLHERFGNLAAEWVPRILSGLRDGSLQPVPQQEEEATECGKIFKEDGHIHWEESAEKIRNRIRAYQPWPGAYIPMGSRGNLKILSAQTESGQGKPGEILQVGSDGPLIACGSGALRLRRVQPPGKNAMDGGSFLNGHPLQPGSVLGRE
ncbi:MAG: methionyl-tRNA formyltransferase [Kiritimatiellia bacterium]